MQAQRGAEDPYLYAKQGPTGVSFHAILHRNGCKGGVGCEPHVSGQHAFSFDGYEWHLSAANAYNASVLYDDGSVEELATRERPHLILDPVTKEPTHLVAGAGLKGFGPGGRTITHIQPIRRHL